MPIAIVVVFIPSKTSCGEMCRWAVVGANRTRSSKCLVCWGNNRRTVTRHRRNTAKTKPLSYSTAAHASNARPSLVYFTAAAVSHTDAEKRGVSGKSNGPVCFLRQRIPERSIPAHGAQDSPADTYVHGAAPGWPGLQPPGEFDCCFAQVAHMHAPHVLRFRERGSSCSPPPS